MQERTTRPNTTLLAECSTIADHPLVDDVTYDARTEETVAALEDSTVNHSLVVVELVGKRKDCCTTELTPLYDTVDPEHIDRLFEDTLADSDIVVAFEYEGYNVTVTADAVAISPLQ